MGLLDLFEDKTLKVRIRIKDRALNESNQVENPEFTLREVQVKVSVTYLAFIGVEIFIIFELLFQMFAFRLA